jgi:hypothetical protein
VTRAETRFRLSTKRTSPFKSAGASVQSTTGSRGVRINGSNAGYTMFRGSVKSSGYPLHSPVSPPARHRVPSHFNWTLRPYGFHWVVVRYNIWNDLTQLLWQEYSTEETRSFGIRGFKNYVFICMEVWVFGVIMIVWTVRTFMNTQKDAYEGQRVRGCNSLSYTNHMLSSRCLSASVSTSVWRYFTTRKQMHLKVES